MKVFRTVLEVLLIMSIAYPISEFVEKMYYAKVPDFYSFLVIILGSIVIALLLLWRVIDYVRGI